MRVKHRMFFVTVAFCFALSGLEIFLPGFSQGDATGYRILPLRGKAFTLLQQLGQGGLVGVDAPDFLRGKGAVETGQLVEKAHVIQANQDSMILAIP